MNLLLSPLATPDAIQTAIRNADRADRQGYSVRFYGNVSRRDVWTVFKPGNTSIVPDYVVTAHPDGATCECEQCKLHGYCKHIELCAREEAYLEQIKAQEEENERMEEGRAALESDLDEWRFRQSGAYRG